MKNPDRELAKLELKLRKIGSGLIHARRASWQQQNAGEKMLDAARLVQEASEAITARA